MVFFCEFEEEMFDGALPGEVGAFDLDEEVFASVDLDEFLEGLVGSGEVAFGKGKIEDAESAAGEAEEPFGVLLEAFPGAEWVEAGFVEVAGGDEAG